MVVLETTERAVVADGAELPEFPDVADDAFEDTARVETGDYRVRQRVALGLATVVEQRRPHTSHESEIGLGDCLGHGCSRCDGQGSFSILTRTADLEDATHEGACVREGCLSVPRFLGYDCPTLVWIRAG